MPENHDRQKDARRVARLLRQGGYSYDQSAHLFKLARKIAGLLDGLLYHESDIDPEEHFVDTHGYTECNFAAFTIGHTTASLVMKRLVASGRRAGSIVPPASWGASSKRSFFWSIWPGPTFVGACGRACSNLRSCSV